MNIIYEKREMEGERLELVDKDSLYYLGPDLTLRHCTVVLRVPAKQLLISPSRFIDCTIQVRQELKNFAWACAALKGCRFEGAMTGCDFGPWRDYMDGWEHGAIEDCDFTKARLSNCRFHGCDPRTLRFPPWPCFTLLDPIGRSKELTGIKWPGRFGEIVIEDLRNDPPSTVAVTMFAPLIAKRYGITEEELRVVIEQFDFIVY